MPSNIKEVVGLNLWVSFLTLRKSEITKQRQQRCQKQSIINAKHQALNRLRGRRGQCVGAWLEGASQREDCSKRGEKVWVGVWVTVWLLVPIG
jgi:hypothetical protein